MDKDLRVCINCAVITYAYICPKCFEYETLRTVPEAEKMLGRKFPQGDAQK